MTLPRHFTLDPRWLPKQRLWRLWIYIPQGMRGKSPKEPGRWVYVDCASAEHVAQQAVQYTAACVRRGINHRIARRAKMAIVRATLAAVGERGKAS